MNILRLANLYGYAALVRQLGCDPAILLADVGLSLAHLDEGRADDYIADTQFVELMEHSIEVCGCPEFVIRLGSRQKMNRMMGTLGFIMQRSRTVGESLLALKKYCHFHAPAVSVDVNIHGELAVFSVRARQRILKVAEELTYAATLPPMRALWGHDWHPHSVHFQHTAPADRRPYRKVFAAPVHFSSENNGFYLHAGDLSTPTTGADPKLKGILEDYIDRMARRYADDPRGLVTQLIRRGLADGEFSSDYISQCLGVNRRTLHRMLDDVNCTYSDVLQEVRDEIARKTLQQPEVPITLLAEMLGYSDGSAFSRAFKRNHNCSPAQWRQTHSGQAS